MPNLHYLELLRICRIAVSTANPRQFENPQQIKVMEFGPNTTVNEQLSWWADDQLNSEFSGYHASRGTISIKRRRRRHENELLNKRCVHVDYHTKKPSLEVTPTTVP